MLKRIGTVFLSLASDQNMLEYLQNTCTKYTEDGKLRLYRYNKHRKICTKTNYNNQCSA